MCGSFLLRLGRNVTLRAVAPDKEPPLTQACGFLFSGTQAIRKTSVRTGDVALKHIRRSSFYATVYVSAI